MQLWQKHIISTGFADKPLDSEWHSMSIDKLSIDRFEMKPWRASSYIPTPENIRIQHTDVCTSKTQIKSVK